jgi:adenylate kinase family enzyme
MHHSSVGDLLRGMGPSGPDINAHIAQGTVLPGSQIIPIIAAHISSLSSHSPLATHASLPPASTARKFTKILVLDGFPRNLEQEELAWKPLASDPGTEFPDLVIYFSCPKAELKRRYVERRRGEDDAALFEKRYEQHERECPAVVERYRERGILVEVSAGFVLS